MDEFGKAVAIFLGGPVAALSIDEAERSEAEAAANATKEQMKLDKSEAAKAKAIAKAQEDMLKAAGKFEEAKAVASKAKKAELEAQDKANKSLAKLKIQESKIIKLETEAAKSATKNTDANSDDAVETAQAMSALDSQALQEKLAIAKPIAIGAAIVAGFFFVVKPTVAYFFGRR